MISKKKNYSFYAPEDLASKIDDIKSRDTRLTALSRSQIIYFIIDELSRTNKFVCPKKKEEPEVSENF